MSSLSTSEKGKYWRRIGVTVHMGPLLLNNDKTLRLLFHTCSLASHTQVLAEQCNKFTHYMALPLELLRPGTCYSMILEKWQLNDFSPFDSVVVNFWPTLGSRHVFPPSELPEDTNNKSHPSNSSQSIIQLFSRSFLLPRKQLSRGYSSFREHHRPRLVLLSWLGRPL